MLWALLVFPMFCMCRGILFLQLGEEGGSRGNCICSEVAGPNPAGPRPVAKRPTAPARRASDRASRRRSGVPFPCLCIAALGAGVGRWPCPAGSWQTPSVLLRLTLVRTGAEGRGGSPCLSRAFHWGNVCGECQPCCGEAMGRGDLLRGWAGGSWGAAGSPRAAGHLLAGGLYWRPVFWYWRNRAGRSSFCNIFLSFIQNHPGFAAFWSTERWRGGGLVISARVCCLRESKSKQGHK